MPFNVGDRVKAVSAHHGWDSVQRGDVGVVASRREAAFFEDRGYYVVNFPNGHGWIADENDLVLARKQVPIRRTAAKLEPTTDREKVAVRLIKRVTKGEGKFTAVKVESEGRLERHDHCGPNCTLRREGVPHLGCKRFNDVRVANDFILKHLARYGLAKRCKAGENIWGYMYEPKLPLAFSKVYTDSETEWTTTLLLKEATDVLYTPMLVDAFNALAEANGNGINVEGSGMHTAFLQGEAGMYPDPKGKTAAQNKMFDNFAKSMGPLLPALYLLGANRMENGEGITRSTGPRQPLVSSAEKYSAIAYRHGAVEFRVFDTCYDNRDQILDNVVTMAQCISKYWHKKFVKPNITMDKPVYFGTSDCDSNTINKLESLYVVKDHIVLLNAGLRCIKPPYMTVKEVKKVRNFKLTVRGIKNVLDTNAVEEAYALHLQEVEINQTIAEAHEFYRAVQDFAYNRPTDVKTKLAQLHKNAKANAKRRYPTSAKEGIAYKALFGHGFLLGGK